MAVILFNKWILAYSGFPFPLALTMCAPETGSLDARAPAEGALSAGRRRRRSSQLALPLPVRCWTRACEGSERLRTSRGRRKGLPRPH